MLLYHCKLCDINKGLSYPISNTTKILRNMSSSEQIRSVQFTKMFTKPSRIWEKSDQNTPNRR